MLSNFLPPETSVVYRHTVAAQTAAATSTLLFYPFDSVKMRIMSQDGTSLRAYHQSGHDFRGTFHALVQTQKIEGFRALYRGASLAVTGAVISWGIYMFLHRSMLSFIYDVVHLERWFVTDFGSSLVASAVTACVSNPIWLIKTRMQLTDKTAGTGDGYCSFRQGFRLILTKEGPRGLCKGLFPQLLLSIPNAAYIPLYDFLKNSLLFLRGNSTITAPEIVQLVTLKLLIQVINFRAPPLSARRGCVINRELM